MNTPRRIATDLLGLSLAIGLLGCDAGRSYPEMAATNVITRSVRPESPQGEKSKEPGADATAETANRKIIYNARVDLVTEDLAKLDAALARLIETSKAYVADSERSGTSGASRHGTWKVRVPVDGYDGFLQGVTALGELVSLKADSQDVGEEFFDLEARQVAKKAEEARLLRHLDVSTGKLDEILAVERELSRVRGEVERMQGRLRYLADLTALATVTITAREIKGYVPPQAPTLGTKLGRAFADSVDALRKFGEVVLILLVAVTPWLPVLLIAAALATWAYRALNRVPTNHGR